MFGDRPNGMNTLGDSPWVTRQTLAQSSLNVDKWIIFDKLVANFITLWTFDHIAILICIQITVLGC